MRHGEGWRLYEWDTILGHHNHAAMANGTEKRARALGVALVWGEVGSAQAGTQPFQSRVCVVLEKQSPGAHPLGSSFSLHPPSVQLVGIYTAADESGPAFSLLLLVPALSLAFLPVQR